jgi:hypothetical protein
MYGTDHSDIFSEQVNTVADYGDEQMNQEQKMGAGHKGVVSGT